MRISLNNMPLDKVAQCVTRPEQYIALVKLNATTASLHKYVATKDVDEAFIEALRIIMALPEDPQEPPSIGFS